MPDPVGKFSYLRPSAASLALVAVLAGVLVPQTASAHVRSVTVVRTVRVAPPPPPPVRTARVVVVAPPPPPVRTVRVVVAPPPPPPPVVSVVVVAPQPQVRTISLFGAPPPPPPPPPPSPPSA